MLHLVALYYKCYIWLPDTTNVAFGWVALLLQMLHLASLYYKCYILLPDFTNVTFGCPILQCYIFTTNVTFGFPLLQMLHFVARFYKCYIWLPDITMLHFYYKCYIWLPFITNVTFPFTQITNITHNSVTLTWVPGYDGGLTQTFRVRYHSEDFEQFTVSRLKKLINIVNELLLLEVWVTFKKNYKHCEEVRALHWNKELSHFDLKSWVTGGTKIRPGYRVIGEFLSQYRVNLTQIFSNYSEIRVEF